MAKARQMMVENLKLVDMVIELVDARTPESSLNPDFEQLYQNKIRVIVLNKKDYADNKKTQLWLEHFTSQGINIYTVNALDSKDVRYLKNKLFELADKKRNEIKKRKGINKTIRAMVVGIPNVGKSTLINSIAGRAKAKTGDKPGVTRSKQWVKIGPYFELMDTPGMLWPKLDNKTIGLHLSYIGSIREEILDPVKLAVNLLEEVKTLYPDALKTRFKLEDTNLPGYDLLELIATNRGMLMAGNKIDTERCATTILREFRTGLIGDITLELPQESSYDRVEDKS